MRIFRRARAAAEQRDEGFDLQNPFVQHVLGGLGATASGESVTPETALRCSAVFACVKIIAETLAQLPVHLYRRKGPDDRERATDHPAYALVTKAANPWTPASEFRLIVGTHFATMGNGYGWVSRDGAGRPVELIQLDARMVSVKLNPLTLEPVYVVTLPDGQQREYSRADIFHVRGIGLDTYKGASTITQAREAIGLSQTLEKHCGSLFSRGAKPSGVLKVKGKKSPEALARIRNLFNRFYQGADAEHRTMLLDDDTAFEQIQLNSVDTQTLEMRKLQIAEISRYWRIPLSMIGEMGSITHANAESLGQQFLTFCILPILKLWCDALATSLLTEAERETYYFEFLVDDIARADLNARMQSYASAIMNSVMCPDEARAKENLPPIPDGSGRVFTRPVNVAPAATDATGGTNGGGA